LAGIRLSQNVVAGEKLEPQDKAAPEIGAL
jgi:hypothetical protein